jgi:hypothetical protein
LPFSLLITLFVFSVFGTVAWADGTVIDKVYHPYVNLLETEVEYRSLFQQDDGSEFDNYQRHKLGIGRSFSDSFLAEVYVIGVNSTGDGLAFNTFEFEAKYQLTEQGEFNNDWGLLFELERDTSQNIWEFSNTVIMLHEWPDWISTTNLSLSYEWGDHISNEFETSLASQMRYRLNRYVEPALELYLGEDTRGLGPVFTGIQRISGPRKLWWEIGMIFGFNASTPDYNLKFNLEYEF